jgi:hypothetical protein
MTSSRADEARVGTSVTAKYLSRSKRHGKRAAVAIGRSRVVHGGSTLRPSPE